MALARAEDELSASTMNKNFCDYQGKMGSNINRIIRGTR